MSNPEVILTEENVEGIVGFPDNRKQVPLAVAGRVHFIGLRADILTGVVDNAISAQMINLAMPEDDEKIVASASGLNHRSSKSSTMVSR